MKKIKKILLMVLILSLIVSGLGLSSVSAEIGEKAAYTGITVSETFADLDFQNVSGCTTVIIDVSGDDHEFDGVLKTDGLEEKDSFEFISSYCIYRSGVVVLEVQIRDVTPKESDENLKRVAGYGAVDANTELSTYYSTTFYLDGENEEELEVFITGLKTNQFEELQNYIITAITNETNLTLSNLTTNLDFIDAEKHNIYGTDNDSDAYLCWAGATSNVLHYTGWAAKAEYKGKSLGLADEDDVFDIFVDSFTDDGGSAEYGFEWFFDGNYYPQEKDWGCSKVDSTEYVYGTFKGFLPGYGCAGYRKVIDEVNLCGLNEALRYLKMGYGEEMGISFYDRRESTGGHALTLWGYVVDNSKSVSDTEHYKAIFITDPDSDKYNSYDTRDARPNKMSMLGLEYENKNWTDDVWWVTGYSSYKTSIMSFELLAPASSAEDADTGEYHDIFSYIDLAFPSYKLSTEAENCEDTLNGDTMYCDQFTESDGKSSIYFSASVNGYTAASVQMNNYAFTYKLQLFKEDNSIGTYEYSSSNDAYGWEGTWLKYKSMPPVDLVEQFGTGSSGSKVLAPGNYKLIATVKANGNEAYTNNNKVEVEFTIGENIFAVRGTSTLTIKASLKNGGKAILAGYNTNGKMIFSKYITDAGKLNTFNISNVSEVTKVVLYPVDENYALNGDSKSKTKIGTTWN